MKQQKKQQTTIWSLVALVLGLLLGGCSQSTPENVLLESQAHQIPLLRGLDGKELFSYEQTNCPVDQFDMPGQGWRAKGSTGGIAALVPPYTAMPTALTEPAVVGQDIYALAALSSLSRSVTILVVDDFNGDTTVSPVKPPVYKLGIDVFKLDTLGFSSVLSTRLMQLDAELERLESTNQISHGAMVMNHINALILGSGHYTGLDTNIADGQVSFQNIDTEKLIQVKAVDTEDLDTTVVASRMQNAILNEINGNRKQIVVNMSFAIVPCTVKDDFEANRAAYPTFQHYANAVATANDDLRGPTETEVQFRNRVRRELTRPFDNDPLRTTIKSNNITGQLGTDGNLLYVASSGNFGLGYSMFPAAWPEVVSASSNDAGSTAKSVFSNKGEVMLTGAWFMLTDPANINSTGILVDENVVYAGTSFSSPGLAVFSAFDIAQAAPRCEMELSSTSAPIPDIAHTPLDDAPLADAILIYCD
jgi:hypothetical protein